MLRRWVLVVCGSAALSLVACKTDTELGVPCRLVKRDPSASADGGRIASVPVKESEIAPGQDFISFGAADCEDLICVRDRGTPRGNPTDDAQGYCSFACVPGVTECEVTDGRAADDLAARMECRGLLLDQATLDRLRAQNPQLYLSTFGENSSPTFCAGRPPDGGT